MNTKLLNPLGFSYIMPVSNGVGTLNMFVGVTQKELQFSKQTDIYKVADKLAQAGYENYVPKKRESVV